MSRRFLCFSVVFLLFLAASAFADAPGVYAITGGTIHPVSGPEITNGAVIIRDGLIESVGSAQAIPARCDDHRREGRPHLSRPHRRANVARISECDGAAASRSRGGRCARTRGRCRRRGRRSSPFARRNCRTTTSKRSAPPASRRSSPRRRSASSTASRSALNLGGGTMESRVIRNPAAQQISFNPRPAWTYPDSLMGVISYIRQTFMDAQQYSAARDDLRQESGRLQASRRESVARSARRRAAPRRAGRLHGRQRVDDAARARRSRKEFNVRYDHRRRAAGLRDGATS